MKTINYFIALLLFVGYSALVGCSDDNTEEPYLTITFANNVSTATLAEGVTQYEINATIASSEGLDQVKVFNVDADGNRDQMGEPITKFDDNKNYNFRQTINNVYDDTKIEIEATDKDNYTRSAIFTIKVTKDTPDPEASVDIWSGRILGAQNNANGSSCASATGMVYTKTEAQNNSSAVDFIYFYQTGSSLSELVSPATANLTWVQTGFATKNATKFTDKLTLSDADYNAITDKQNAATITTYASTASLDKAEKLQTGNYIGFKTATGKLGIIKVVGISGSETGSMTIEIKVLR